MAFFFLKRFVCLFSSTRPCNLNRVCARALASCSIVTITIAGKIQLMYEMIRTRKQEPVIIFIVLVCEYMRRGTRPFRHCDRGGVRTRTHIFSRRNRVHNTRVRNVGTLNNTSNISHKLNLKNNRKKKVHGNSLILLTFNTFKTFENKY